jgi:O-antigen ligase
MDPQFIERIQSIQSEEGDRDGSSSERITSWKAGFKMIGDYPFGTGGSGFEALSPIYIPEIVANHGGNRRNVHSTFIQTAAEWGIPGFIFFMGILLTTLSQLHKIRKTPPSTEIEHKIHLYSLAIELGIVGSMVAGVFTSRIYGEATYWLPAFTAVLVNINAHEKAKAREESTSSLPVKESGLASGSYLTNY